MTDRIYLDNAATTPVAPEVLEAMNRLHAVDFANASSSHEAGAAAQKCVKESRKTLANCLACKPEEIVFTSGGSEANNLAIFGTARASRRRKIVVSAIEHPSVLEPARELAARGFELTTLPVDQQGLVDDKALANAVDDDTFLVSIIHANNEIGTVQDINRLASLVKRADRKVLFHTDAVQSFAHMDISLAGSPIDLLTLSAHKFHGPKGTGALFVRKGTKLRPLIFGGSQEAGRRAGTSNVPALAGMAMAAELMHADVEKHRALLRQITDSMTAILLQEIPDIIVNGPPQARLPGMLSVSFPGVKAQNLMHFADDAGVVVSAGAACRSTSTKPSPVMTAIGRAPSYGTLRISPSIYTTHGQAEKAARRIAAAARRLAP